MPLYLCASVPLCLYAFVPLCLYAFVPLCLCTSVPDLGLCPGSIHFPVDFKAHIRKKVIQFLD